MTSSPNSDVRPRLTRLTAEIEKIHRDILPSDLPMIYSRVLFASEYVACASEDPLSLKMEDPGCRSQPGLKTPSVACRIHCLSARCCEILASVSICRWYAGAAVQHDRQHRCWYSDRKPNSPPHACVRPCPRHACARWPADLGVLRGRH